MLTLDDLVERLRHAANAEFSFALSFEGVLVTRHAPQLMPEAGRTFLVSVAEELVGKRDVGFVCLPRADLVPYGGPGPVEIGFAVAASSRIICVVMTTSAQRNAAREAMEQHLPVIEAFLAPPDAPHAAPHIEVRPQVPLGEESLAAIRLDTLRRDTPVSSAHATVKLGLEAPRVPAPAAKKDDQPTITVGPAAPLGRETLAAIHLDEHKNAAPRIVVEPARKLGRETLAAIERDIAVEGAPLAKPTIPQDLRRQTLPWIDPTLASRQPNAGKGKPGSK